MNINGNTITFYSTIGGDITNKDQLKDNDIVTLRNGDKLIYFNGQFIDLDEDNNTNMLSDTYELNDNMTMNDRDYKNSDIIKVERPYGYSTIFEREEEPREMTLAEICKELGYNVKIVKEEE